jgi:ligand-binding sensor domain-containing protein
MKHFFFTLAIMIIAVPVLSCTPDDSPSSEAAQPEPVESFSVGAPVLDLAYLDGEIWASTSEGVFRCNPGTGDIRRYTEDDGLGNNTVREITGDAHGNIWVSCYVNGVCRFDGNTWQHFTVDDGLVSNDVITLAADAQGGIWVSAYWGVSYYDGTKWEAYTSMPFDAPVTGGENPNNPDAEVVADVELSAADVIFIDSKGKVWFSNRPDGVTRYDGENWTLFSSENGLEARGVRAITEDKDGNLWFGSYRGLTSYDGSQFTSRTIEQYKGLVPPLYIQDIKIDTRGDIWIAAYGGGFGCYDGTDWEIYNPEEGLPGKNGRFIFFDREGNPGVVTAEGVSFLKGTDWNLLTAEDGIPDGKIRALTTDDSGGVWFGSENGIISRMK